MSFIKMVLGIFTDDFYPIKGGQGRHIYEFFTLINPSKVIVFSPSENDLENHVKISCPIYKKTRNFGLSIKVSKNIQKLIEQYNLSRLNIHCGPGGLFLLKKLSIPVIATCHHTYWQQSHYIKNQYWKRFFIPFERKTYQNADKIICVSKDSKSILVEKYGIDEKKIRIIPNGVDISIFKPLNEIKKIPNSLLYVGRIDKRKGLDFLLKSMINVIKANNSIHLYIGGKGSKLTKYKKFIKKKGMENNVHFLGFIPDNNLNEWYNRVKLVVIPSIFEGFGITVIEAMAAGTTVLATNVNGIRTIIKDRENGMLVDYGDNTGLKNAILSFFLNNKFLHLRENALNEIQSKFRSKLVNEEIIDFLFT